MENYQRAAEAIRSGDEYPLQLIKNAGLTAIGGGAATLGSKAASRLIPAIGSLINKYVPDNLSMAGLGKIDPRFNELIQGAMQDGYTYDDIRNFLGEKVKNAQQQETAKDQRNIIEKESPELHQFIMEQVQQGRSPVEAGALATLERKGKKSFKNIIDKIVSDHKAPWAAILETAYGSPQKGKQQQQQEQEGVQSAPSQSGQNALMDVLNKLSQLRGAK